MADATTAEKELTDVYQLIIAGSCFLTLDEGLEIKLVFGSTLPAVGDAAHNFNTFNSPLVYTGGLNVYARRNFEKTGSTKTVIKYTGF